MTESNKAAKVIVAGARATASAFVVRFGARIGFLYVAAHLFGVALFGAYSLAVATIEVAVTIGGLGAKRILFKRLEEAELDRPRAHIVLDSAVLVGGASLLLAGALATVVAMIPARLIAPNVAFALIVLAPMIAGQALLDLLLAATRWTHAIRYEITARSLLEPYAALAAAGGAALLGFQQDGLVISYWVGTVAALAYAAVGLRRCLGGFALRSYRFPAPNIGPMLRESAAATFNDLLNGVFGRIDLYLVGIFMGETGAGIYGMARQIRTPVRQVRQSFDGLLNPIIARTLALKGPTATGYAAASAARLILALQLPILLALIFGGEPFLASFGPAFVAGYWAMLLLGAAEMIQGAFGVSDLIILYRQPLAQLRITASNIAVNLAAGAVLITPLGVTGAGFAVLCGVLAGSLIRRASMRTHFEVRVPLRYNAGPVAAALAALGAGWLARGSLTAFAPRLADGAAVLLALVVYAGCLKLWMAASGETLSLEDFTTRGTEG